MNSVFLTPDAWKAEVTKMRDCLWRADRRRHGGIIIKYLSANYAVPPKS